MTAAILESCMRLEHTIKLICQLEYFPALGGYAGIFLRD